MITTVVGSQSMHTQEVAAIRGELRSRIDIYMNIDPQRIIYLLQEIFVDAWYFFSGEVHSREPLTES